MMLTQRSLLCAALLITALQTTLVLQYSATEGRLALPVYFDDSHSMVDGARRLELWYLHGSAALYRDYLANPPHAPGHSALAMAAFALFGLHEWAPYLTNAIFFGLVLYSLILVLRGVDPWLQIPCMLLLASTPIAGLSIVEFRSEVIVAELGVLGIILFIGWSRKRKSVWHMVASSLCFAACFIIKPAVCPYTLGLMGLCVLYHLQHVFSVGSDRITLRNWCLLTGFFFLLGILPPLPHYLLDWRQITSYIDAIAFSSTSVWLRHDDRISSLLFNLTGYPGTIMLGGFLKFAVTLIAGGILVRILRTDSWPASLPLFSLIFFSLGAYAGVAVNPMNQNYFGMTFHWLLLITALVALCGMTSVFFPKCQILPAIVLGCVAVVAFFGFKFPLSIDFYREKAGGDPATFSWLQHSPELVMAPIRSEQQRSGATKIWITAYTMINARTLEWYTLLHHEPFLYRDFIESDWSAVPRSLEWADIVVVPEKGTPSMETIPPNAAMADAMESRLDHDSRFQLIERLPSPHDGPGFRIYAKKNPSSSL